MRSHAKPVASAVRPKETEVKSSMTSTRRTPECKTEDQRMLTEAREALDQERAAFEAEKDAMSRMATRDDDIIDLNVGGRHLTTTRGVLTAEEGLLSGMFSGRWDQSLSKDKKCRVFLDFDPDCFEIVLHQLRLSWLTGRLVDWQTVVPNPGKEAYFEAFTGFLGISWEQPRDASKKTSAEPDQNVVEAPRVGTEVELQDDDEPLSPLSPASTHSDRLVSEGGSTVTNASRGHGCTIGARVMDSGVVTWGFRINRLVGNVVLGVIGVELPEDIDSYKHVTAHGWSNNQCMWKSGRRLRGAGGWQGFQSADVLKMRLDADRGILQMKVSRLGDQVFQMTGLGRQPWRVHAFFCNSTATNIEVFASEF